MALSYHPDLCFIHIPKTGGNYFGRVLASKEGFDRPGKLDGAGHALPRRWDYEKYVTLVRMPHTWIRSVWNHRNRGGWPKGYPSDCPWKDFLHMTHDCKDHNFEKFAYKLINRHPGVVTWLYNSYVVPQVKAFRIEYASTELKQFGNVDVEIPNAAINLPEISLDLQMTIYDVEYETYLRWYPVWQP